MKVKTDPTIQSMSGRFPGSRLVMVNPSGKLLTNARAHVIPDNEAQQQAFSSQVQAVAQAWQNADAGFKTDMGTYKSAYNLTIIDNEHMNVSAYALFVKACFAASDKSGFDLTTLNISVDNSTFISLLDDAELEALSTSIAPAPA